MEETKYKKEIDQLLSQLFREDWMNDDDWAELKEEVMKTEGLSYQELSNDLEIGVKNGYPIKIQIELAEIMIKTRE